MNKLTLIWVSDKPIQTSQEDKDFKKLREQTREHIVSTFGVPSSKLTLR